METEEHVVSPAVAPLDAYTTAKPDEPTWTVQGGDPLGGVLLRLWALLSRTRAGVLKPQVEWLTPLISAAEANKAENKRERDDLLKRATLTEEVSWDMDNYLKTGTGASEAEISGEKLTVDERLTLFELRTFAAGRISGMFSELAEIAERLADAKFEDEATLDLLPQLHQDLRRLYNLVQPTREKRINA